MNVSEKYYEESLHPLQNGVEKLFSDRELDLIEPWGTGIQRIFQEAEELGLQEPEIMEIGMRVRMTIYLAETMHVGPVEQSDHARAHDEAHDLSKTEKYIIQ